MRSLMIQVVAGSGDTACAVLNRHAAQNVTRWSGQFASGAPSDLILAQLSNQKVGPCLDLLERTLPEAQITLWPQAAMPLHPPSDKTPDQVTDVGVRSPIEVYLGGLQSVGSWIGFLAYAFLAGIVVWIGLYTDAILLLIGAMLIAPFAGPAMNCAMATARGDGSLLRRNLLRYFAALLVTIATAAMLSLIFGQKIATATMVATATLSSVAVLLPLAAGAGGALHLVQSERSSLVSGAAVGLLIAASLAPPAGMVGMAAALGLWDMAVHGVFVLLLQLVGINVAGAIVFRLFGLAPRGVRFTDGRRGLFPAVLSISVAALGLLLWWQFRSSPNLQRSTQAQRAAADIREFLDHSKTLSPVEVNTRFTRAEIPRQETLLILVYAQRRPTARESSDQIERETVRAVQALLRRKNYNVTPLVSVNVLEPPPAPP